MIKIIIPAVFLLFVLNGCSQGTNEDMMKAAASKLLKYLATNDPAAILRLHARYDDYLQNNKEYKESLIKVLDDCTKYQEIVKKYGTPTQ